MFCRNCGTKLNEGAAFCIECGHATKTTTCASSFPDDNIATQTQSTIIFCRECATKLNENAAFCIECGHATKTIASVSSNSIITPTQNTVAPYRTQFNSIPSQKQRDNIATAIILNISAYQRNILLIGILAFVLCRFLFLVFHLMSFSSNDIPLYIEVGYTFLLSLFCILSINTLDVSMKKRLIVITVLINLLLLLRVWSIFTVLQYKKALSAYSGDLGDLIESLTRHNGVLNLLNLQWLACAALIIAINFAIIVFLGKLKHSFKPDDHYLIHSSIFFCLLQIASETGLMFSFLYISNDTTPWFFYNFIYLYMAIMLFSVAIKFPRFDLSKQM